MIQIKKGLDLPISGAPEMQVGEPLPVSHVALLGRDYQDMKPTLLVAEGDQVVLGHRSSLTKRTPRFSSQPLRLAKLSPSTAANVVSSCLWLSKFPEQKKRPSQRLRQADLNSFLQTMLKVS
jgi:hypothetical protein